MLNILQEEQIRLLRSQGVGYRQIANRLNLSRDAVRYYCKANDLNGHREAVLSNTQCIKTDENFCTCCGELLVQPKTGRKRRFCLGHAYLYTVIPATRDSEGFTEHTCKRCGKEFTAYGNPHRKYCSHECFISDRYWGGEEPAKATGIKGIQKIFYSAKGHV